MSHILRVRADSARPPLTLTRLDLVDRLVPIRCLAVAVGSAAEALGDRRMVNSFAELAERIETDLDALIDEIEEAAQ